VAAAPAEIDNFESVRRWLASRKALWGETGETPGHLRALSDFCAKLDKNPDEMIDECLRRSSEGGPFVLRTRARREYIQLIEKFEAEGAGRQAANSVRSFFIHNGVAMNPSIVS
jgi:hypothetical protein